MAKALAISGGSTKIPMLAGAALTALKSGLDPEYIVGISSGGILSLPLALGKYKEVEDLVKSFNLDNVFDKKPVNEEGKVTLNAKLRILSGKESLGTQHAVIAEIQKIVSKNEFIEYTRSHQYPTVFIGTVEFRTGRRVYYNLKSLSYEEYLKVVLATGSIPGFVEGVRMPFIHDDMFHEGIFYDGGTRDHIGSAWLLENYGHKIDELVCIYSRPENYNIEDMGWYPKNALTPILRALDIMLTEISKTDQALTQLLAKQNNIKLKKIFFNYVASSMYEIDPVLLEEWYDAGVEEANKILNNEN